MNGATVVGQFPTLTWLRDLYSRSVRRPFRRLGVPRRKSLSLGPWALSIKRQCGRRRFLRDRDLVSHICRDQEELPFCRSAPDTRYFGGRSVATQCQYPCPTPP